MVGDALDQERIVGTDMRCFNPHSDGDDDPLSRLQALPQIILRLTATRSQRP
jgi:hypothetical protein